MRYGTVHWYPHCMHACRKVTVELPEELLRRAQESTGEGVTATIRHGLELVAARRAADELRRLRGTVRFSVPTSVLREDRG